MQLHLLNPQELDDPTMLGQNRIKMLHYLAGTHALPVERLICDVTAACRHGLTLGELKLCLAPADSMLVRSAAFRLILRGEVRCPTLAVKPLGVHTRLAPG